MVVLVSESAISRKTSAMTMAIEFIEPLDTTFIIPHAMTPESLYEALSKRDPSLGFIVAGEMSTFFSKAKYQEALAGLVTDLNDAPHGLKERYTLTYGGQPLTNPCLGMVAATTPTGLAAEMPHYVRSAGFIGRLLLVYESGPRHANAGVRPIPPELIELRKKLHEDMQRIAAIKGRMRFTDAARDRYESWYTLHFARTTDPDEPPHLRTTGWLGRKHSHLLRTAMVLSAAERSDLWITVEHIEQALALVDVVEENYHGATSQFDRNDEMEIADRVERAFIRHGDWNKGGWAQVSHVHRIVHIPLTQFKKACDHIIALGRLELSKRGARGAQFGRIRLAPSEIREMVVRGWIPMKKTMVPHE